MSSDLNEMALADWLDVTHPSLGGLVSVDKFADGQSNPTYRVGTGAGEQVLRRKPFGSLLASAHAVEREFRLISALHPTGYPVAAPIALCEDDAVIGSPFYLMEMVEGRSFWDGALPGMDPEDRRLIYDAMIDTLARLHAIEVDSVGLETFGRPGNYFARQMDRWERQYRASQTEPAPQIDALIAFLAATVPAQSRTTILHGDYRIDNLIYRHDRPEIAAVLDWELATLGDPMADLTYLALNWVMPQIPGRSLLGGLDLPALGIPTLPQMIDRYAAAAGLDEIPPLDWYLAFNLFRGIGIAQGVKKRMIDGNASSDNAAAVIEPLPRLRAAAVHFAEQAGASIPANP